jgi:hypothetical protein
LACDPHYAIKEKMTNDFIEYWSAARLLLNNGNAYSPAELYRMEQSVGWSEAAPLLIWNPPWTLALLLPFGLLEHDTAQFIWFLLHTVIIFLGAEFLWRVYAGTPSLSRIAWIALLSFAPVYFVLLLGQIGPLVLAGVIGFLLAARQGAWIRAGSCLAIASIKPHLLYLLWLVVLVWVGRERRWQVGAGFVVTFAIMAIAPLLLDQQIYARYLALLSDRTVVLPQDWATPTLGTAISVLVGNRHSWLRWLPALAGVLWLYRFWQKNADRWDWSEDLPLILMVSVATAPFSWTFDYVVLLPAVMQSAAWVSASDPRGRARWFAWLYLALCLILIIGKVLIRTDFWYFWVAPALLVLYLSLIQDRKTFTVG